MRAIPNILKWKFKKLHKPNFKFKRLVERKIFIPAFYEFAIQAGESGKLTFKQLEACRRALRRGLGKTAKILFSIAVSVPLSKKPIAARMGKGKGAISLWVAVVRAGKILVEVNCPKSSKTYVVLAKAATKLPIKTKLLHVAF